MKPASMIAIYLLFWVISAFFVMPFGIRAHSDDGGAEMVPGQAESAPSNFHPRRIILRTTLVAAVLFGLFYANFRAGWFTIEDVSLVHPPASLGQYPH